MKVVGMILAVVGIVILVAQMVMGVTTYHLTRTHDMHKFLIWMAVGLVIAIVGGILARQGDQ